MIPFACTKMRYAGVYSEIMMGKRDWWGSLFYGGLGGNMSGLRVRKYSRRGLEVIHRMI